MGDPEKEKKEDTHLDQGNNTIGQQVRPYDDDNCLSDSVIERCLFCELLVNFRYTLLKRFRSWRSGYRKGGIS